MVVRVGLLTALADLITGLLYLRGADEWFFWLPLWFCFALTAGALWSLRWCPACVPGTRLTVGRAMTFGVVHGLLWPAGISRLGGMFVTARWLGFRGQRAFELAWLLQVPLIGALLVRDYFRNTASAFGEPLFLPGMLPLLLAVTALGFAAFCAAGYLARTNQFWRFSYYMVAAAAIALLFGC